MSVSGSGFEAGLGREEQSRFTRRLPSRKSVVAATHSRTSPASADLHPAGNDRQAAGPTASAPCLDDVAAPSGRAQRPRRGRGGYT